MGRIKMQLEVIHHDLGDLLDFQRRIAAIDGVRQTSIVSIDSERAVILVRLDRDTPVN